MLLEVWLGMLLEVGRQAEVVLGRQSFHMQELEVGRGMVGKGMVGEGTLLEAWEQKGKAGSHLVGGLL